MLDKGLLKAILWKLAAIYALLVIAGLLLDQLSLLLLIGTVALFIVNIHQFYKLLQWIWQVPQKHHVGGKSMWDHLYYGVENIQRSNRRRRQQLIHSLGQFRQGADALPDGVVVYNQYNNIVWCNSQARLLLGLKWPEDQGQRLDNLIRYPQFSQYLSEHDFEQVLIIPSPRNELMILEHRIIEYGHNQFLLVSRDITRLQQLEDMRREFVANVSHELKTPLTVLQGYLELMSDNDEVDASWQMATNAMKQQTSRMKGMVEQLLALSKIESSNHALIKKVVLMSAQINMLREDALALIGTRDLSIEFNIAPELDVYGDEAQIFSACTNLVTNAIRYCEDGSHIKVVWQRCTDGAMFSVTDDGPGIAPVHLHRLTERFYRIEQSRSSSSGGSGLGLSIVKHVLLHHQSTLNIDSTLGKGSCFSFVINNERLIAI